MLEVHNLIIDFEENELDTTTYFNIGLEKAQTYRLADRRTLALDVLDGLYNLDLDAEQMETLDEFICIIEIEQQVIDGTISLIGETPVYNLLAACRGEEFRIVKPANTEHNTYTENINLLIFPNPAQTILTISTTLENYTATLINPIGVTLFKENVSFEKVIDVSSYP